MKNNQTASDKRCLSCPNMITEGDYCKECSDTPDGRTRAEEEIREAFEKEFKPKAYKKYGDSIADFYIFSEGYTTATQKAQAEIEELKKMVIFMTREQNKAKNEVKELEQQIEELKGKDNWLTGSLEQYEKDEIIYKSRIKELEQQIEDLKDRCGSCQHIMTEKCIKCFYSQEYYWENNWERSKP